MEAGSRFADSYTEGFQDDENSFMHSMTSKANKNRIKMEADRDQFISENVDTGAKLVDAGGEINRIRGVFKIGHGLHAVMDQYSPAHTGKNQFWKMSHFYRHGDMPFSIEGLKVAQNPKYDFVINKMREVW